MSADLIRKMQENVAKYGKQNVTTLLMMQAIRELQNANDERDQLKAANAELAAALALCEGLIKSRLEINGVIATGPGVMARAALTKHQGATA